MDNTFAGVVVGYDATPQSELALTWAVETARRTGQEVLLVHTLHVDVLTPMAPIEPFEWMPDGDLAGPGPDAPAVDRATAALGPGRVHLSRSVGSAAQQLIEASRTASLVVTGSRGRGTFAAGILGSTAYFVAAHAHCPVVVVRAEPQAAEPPMPDPDHKVVVGIEDVEGSGHILDVAAALAADRRAPLQVVRVRLIPPADMWGFSPGPGSDAQMNEAMELYTERVMSAAVARVRGRHPQLSVQASAFHGDPGHLLARQSQGAGIVVVGSRGRGGFAGLLLGSVSHDLIHQATCPVMIVR